MKEVLYVVVTMALGYLVADCSTIIAESVRIEHDYAHRTVDPAVIALLRDDK